MRTRQRTPISTRSSARTTVRAALALALLGICAGQTCIPVVPCDVLEGIEDDIANAPVITTFDGNWLSEEFGYAIEITNRTAVVTLSNATVYSEGDVIVAMTSVDGNTFTGRHMFTDGSCQEVLGSLTNPNTLLLAGGGFTWTLTRLDSAATNQAPIADSQNISTPFETPAQIILTGSDPDNAPQPLTFTLQSLPATGRLEGEPPNLTYIPASGFVGNDVFSFTANDGRTTSAAATIFITVGAQQNLAPTVNAGENQSITFPTNFADLSGTVTDDGLPAGNSLSTTWSQVSGPGNVTFTDPSAEATTATFSAVGNYVLELEATDGELTSSDRVTIFVHGTVSGS